METATDTLAQQYGARSDQGRNAYESLREAILSGRKPQGMRLSQRILAREFNVSRMPVREALTRLSAEGLVVEIPRVGAFVRKLSHDEGIELLKFRRAVESAAAAMAAEEATPEERAELEQLARDADEQMDSRLYRGEVELSFHRRVAEVSKNPDLLRVFEHSAAMYLTLFVPSSNPELPSAQFVTPTVHTEIARAIAGGDPALAFKVVWDSLQKVIEHETAARGVVTAQANMDEEETPMT